MIAEAGVNKATFYRHFPSKEALVLAWLRDSQTRWFHRVRAAAVSRASDPSDLIPALFDAVAGWLEDGGYRGCPYLDTSVEISESTRPTAQAVREYLAEIGAYLEAAVAETGHPEPVRIGRAIHTLLAGAIALGVANRTNAHVTFARDAVMRLIA